MTQRRFIAGAVCPACGALDKITVETSETEDGTIRTRVCAACGFTDSPPEEKGWDTVRIPD